MGWNHHGCQLSKSSESFVLNQNQMSTIFCWSPRIPVNEFFVGDDDEKESNMQGSLWLRAYWGLLRREWLTAQVFLLADSISLPPLFTQPTTASSALPAFRSGMRCDNTKYQEFQPHRGWHSNQWLGFQPVGGNPPMVGEFPTIYLSWPWCSGV